MVSLDDTLMAQNMEGTVRHQTRNCLPPARAATAILFVAVLSFTGCAPKDRATADAWLQTMAGASTHNVEGRWIGPNKGYGILGQQPFGSITLAQDGNRLIGQMPDHELMGAVSGKTVRLVGVLRGEVHYTFHLTLSPTLKPPTMLGRICYGYHPNPNNSGDCNGIEFRKRR